MKLFLSIMLHRSHLFISILHIITLLTYFIRSLYIIVVWNFILLLVACQITITSNLQLPHGHSFYIPSLSRQIYRICII